MIKSISGRPICVVVIMQASRLRGPEIVSRKRLALPSSLPYKSPGPVKG